jgi:signal transduction histidine kinase
MNDLPLDQALRKITLLADLTDEHIQWIAKHSEERRFNTGEVIGNAGDPAEFMMMLIEGEIEGRSDDHVLYIGTAGEISGKLPHSRMQKFPLTMRAAAPVRAAVLHQKHFDEMLDQIPELEVRLVRLMADRIREYTTSEVQQSKLAALGKLSAGLAHELNNPASAASRAADAIREELARMRDLDCRVAEADIRPEQRTRVVTIQGKALDHARGCTPLDALTRSDREEELGSHLSDMGVNDAWDLAPELMDAGFTRESLTDLAEAADGAFAHVLARIAMLIRLDRLAQEIQESTSRISRLVTSIKDYSYMDTAAEREVDVHRDIENTLTILGNKIRKSGVAVERLYDKSLPVICANGSELNQVWTNLIENAIDAMAAMPDGAKTLRLRTSVRLDRVVVEVLDNGPGIPDNIRERIFEPFFTTKKQGEGSGLGLDVVRRIVRRHHGDILVESQPGNTSFEVRLPIARAASSSNT